MRMLWVSCLVLAVLIVIDIRAGRSLGAESAAELLPESREKDPHLIFKKSVVVKRYKTGQVLSESHTVKRGDHLWKILRDRYHLSDMKIAFFCKVARVINPDLKDVHSLYPDQNILLPYKYINDENRGSSGNLNDTDVEPQVYVVKKGDHFAKIMRQNFNLSGPIIFSRNTFDRFKAANPDIEDMNRLEPGQRIIFPPELMALGSRFVPIGSLEPDPVEPAVKQPPLPSVSDVSAVFDNATITRDMLSLLTHSFNGRDNRTGIEKFEMAGSGTLQLDYSKFPLYVFPGDKKILIDYGNKMPDGVKSVIRSNWENAEIVGVKAKEDMASILDRVLDVCGFYKVEKNSEYTANRDNIQVSVNGDWIVFKDESLKNVFVVNLINDDSKAISPSLKSYLSGMGLNFVDIHNGRKVSSKSTDAARPIQQKRISAETIVLTDTLLNIAGIDYGMNQSVDVLSNSDQGFSLEVVADRLFKKDGMVHMIDFHSLPIRIYDVIQSQGIKLLNISGDEEMLSAAQKILVFCEIPFQPSPVEFHYKKGSLSRLKLKVPGVLVKLSSGDILLTNVILQEAIVRFLADINVEIVQF